MPDYTIYNAQKAGTSLVEINERMSEFGVINCSPATRLIINYIDNYFMFLNDSIVSYFFQFYIMITI